jgi:thiol-disulfide isomerase/thioredoxin
MTRTVIFIILVTVGAFSYYFFSNSKKNLQSDKTKTTVNNTDKNINVNNDQKSGKYVTLETDTKNEEDKKIVYFFFANWCSTCIPADKEISENINNIPNGVKIIRVNYNDTDTSDEEEALAQKYGITYQHTFVQVDENGNVISKWNGGGLSNILSKIK